VGTWKKAPVGRNGPLEERLTLRTVRKRSDGGLSIKKASGPEILGLTAAKRSCKERRKVIRRQFVRKSKEWTVWETGAGKLVAPNKRKQVRGESCVASGTSPKAGPGKKKGTMFQKNKEENI